MSILRIYPWPWVLVVLCFCLSGLPAQAQGEFAYWFGPGPLRFTPQGPELLATMPPMDTSEGSASISDAQGNLLFSTDGSNLFTRTHEVMPHGRAFGFFNQWSSTQSALILPDPGNSARYYVFRIGPTGNQNALAFLQVDMRLNRGQGDVRQGPVDLLPELWLTEKLTGVPHANGRDWWVLVHEYKTAQYLAFLVTAEGVTRTPVSSFGAVSHGSMAKDGFGGWLRAAPNGKAVAAVVTRSSYLEVADFNAATGQVEHPQFVQLAYDPYGLEFSPDGQLLYVTGNEKLHQFEFTTSSATVLAASDIVVGELVIGSSLHASTGAVARGPDDHLYIAQYSSWLGIVDEPNVRGRACGFRTQGFYLAPWIANYGLPNFPQRLPRQPQPAVQVTAARTVCVGTPLRLQAATQPASADTTGRYVWQFGDRGSEATTPIEGYTVHHTYTQPGTYTVQLAARPTGSWKTLTARWTVEVVAPPAVSLGAAEQPLCAGGERTLQVQTDAANQVRWADGSTARTRVFTQTGRYPVTVTSPGGCQAQTEVLLVPATVPHVQLGADTTLCTVQALTLRPRRLTPEPIGYRWSDGSTGATLQIQTAGTYWVEVQTAAGCSARDSILVRPQVCPVMLPNIFTPNADGHNDTWEVQGLAAGAYGLDVYTRWGQHVYHADVYANNWAAAGLSTGTYFYRLRPLAGGLAYQGWVTVER